MGLFGWSRGRLPHPDAAEDAATAPAEKAQPPPTSAEADGDRAATKPVRKARADASANGHGAEKEDGAADRAATGGASLREALQQLYAQRPSREKFAEEALELIAKAAGVKSAALLDYDARADRVRLLCGTGLEPEAVEILNGESRANAWDIPLRGLKSQRINVIESAHENPFVPKPLAAISPRKLTIAVLPFFHAAAPIGVVVLFSPTLRGFSNSLLHLLSNALRVCGGALTQLSSGAIRSASTAAEANQQPTLLRGLNALKAQLAHLTKALEEAERQRAAEAAERVTAESFLRAERDRLAALEKELAAAREERQRFPSLAEKIEELTETSRRTAAEADAAKAEVGRLQAGLQAAEARVQERAAAVSELTTAQQALQQRLEAARAEAAERAQSITRLEQELQELAARSAAADELEPALAAAEAARATAEAGLTSIRDELAAARAARAELQAALQESSESLSAAQSEARTLAGQLAEARAKADRVEAQERAVADLQREIESIENKRAELQRTVKSQRQQLADAIRQQEEAARSAAARAADIEAERDRAAGELARLREQSGHTLDELHERIESSERDRREMAERIEALTRADSERVQLLSRVEELEQDLLSAQDAAQVLEARAQELSQAGARLIAERAELQARVETLAAGGQTLEHEKQAAITAAHRRLSQVEEELNRLAATLDTTRTAAASELNQVRTTAERELRAVRNELAAITRARESLQQDLDRVQEELNAVRQESATLAAERDRLHAAIAELTHGRETVLTESEQVRTVLAQKEQRIAELQAEIQAAQVGKEALVAQLNEQLAEMTLHQDALEQEHRAERERLLQALAEKDLLLQAAEDRLTVDVGEGEEDLESMLVIDRSGAVEPEEGAEEPAAPAEVSEPVVRELVIVDGCGLGDQAATQLAKFGHRITAYVPDPNLPLQLVERQIACAAINLATPAAWEAVRMLRNGNGKPQMPFVAYALAANAATGFWFGPVDFAVLPISEGSIFDMVTRMAPRVKRVIAMSTDIDVMSEVRAQLSGKGISTAVVLDGRQALDLVPTVRPEAAVLHLSPSCVDVFRAIAGLRNTEASRNIPILFLLDPAAHAQEESFLNAGVRLLSLRGNLPSGGLVNSLAEALGGYRSL